MGIRDFFQNIHWPATLQIAVIRVIVASILWLIVLLAIGNIGGSNEFFATAMTLLFILPVFLAVAILAMGLSRAGLPFIGLLALPAWFVVIGDPVVWIMHRAKPEWVPADSFQLINPPVLAIFKDGSEIQLESGID